MATTFPNSLQDLDSTRGSATQKLNNPSHVTHHALEDDTLEALETKVGIDSSAVTTSLDYKLKSSSSSNPGHKHTLSYGASNVTATYSEVNILDGVTSTSAEINILDGIVPTTAELNFVDGVTSTIQVQLDTKLESGFSPTNIASGIINTTEFENLDGLNQTLATTDDVTFNDLFLTGTAIIVGNLDTTGSITGAGDITGVTIYGDGSNLTDVGAAAASALTISAKVNEGAGITKGKIVYLSGATGQFPQVSLADNTNVSKYDLIGMSAEAKTDGQTILIRVAGELTGLDTSAYIDGNPIYLTTAGKGTSVIPSSGSIQHVGHVAYAHASQGKVIVGSMHDEAYVAVASSQDLDLRMGDDIGVNKVIFENYSDTEVGYIDSLGNLALDGTATITGKLTASTIGGITEANLVDKSVTETISGAWTLGDFSGTASTLAVTGTLDLSSGTATILILDNSAVALSITEGTTNYLAFTTTNAGEKIVAGVDFEVGNITIDEDAGAVSLVAMSVSATPAAGTEESYAFQIDSSTIMKIYSEADSSGGITSPLVDITGSAAVSGNLTVADHLSAGTTVLGEILNVVGSATISSNLDITNDTTIGGDLNLTGTAAITGNITGATFGGITSANLVDKSATESISGSWTFDDLIGTASVFATSGDINIGGSAIITSHITAVDGTFTGDINVTGSAIVTDNISTTADLAVTGTATVTDNITIGGDLDLTGTATITSNITAAAYDGIIATNLVDLSATESITGAWSMSSLLATGGSAVLTNVQGTAIYFNGEYNLGDLDSSPSTIDWQTGNKQAMIVNNTAVLLAFTAPTGVCNLILKVTQGTTATTVTWPSSVLWPAGTAPTLSTTAADIDVLSFYFDGSSYFGNSSLDFS